MQLPQPVSTHKKFLYEIAMKWSFKENVLITLTSIFLSWGSFLTKEVGGGGVVPSFSFPELL